MKRLREPDIVEKEPKKEEEKECFCHQCERIRPIASATRRPASKEIYQLFQALDACPHVSKTWRDSVRPFIKSPEDFQQLQQESEGEESTEDLPIVIKKEEEPPRSPLFIEPEDLLYLPPISNVMAWRNPKYWPRVLARFPKVCDAPKHPCSAYCYMDSSIDPATGKRKHDYYVDGIHRTWDKGWATFSTLSKGHIFADFDQGYHSKRLADKPDQLKNKPQYQNKTAEANKKYWEDNAAWGNDRHESFEWRLLYHFEKPLPEGLPEAPPGFYRWLCDISDHGWMVEWTEQAIAHRETQSMGEFDLMLKHKETGMYQPGDFKNCDDWDFFEKDKKGGATKKRGIHVSTMNIPSNNGGKYGFQGDWYRAIQLLAHPEVFESKFTGFNTLVNFHPADPDYYRVYDVPACDLRSTFFRDFMPWDSKSLKHQQWQGHSLIPRFETLGPNADPRCNGLTQRKKIALGKVDEQTMVWCGYSWVSGSGRSAEVKKKIQNEITSRKRRKQPFKDLLTHPDDLDDSPWKHPLRWYGDDKRPESAYGLYEHHLLNSAELLSRLPQVYGKTLLCWCPETDELCHAHCIAAYANLWKAGAFELPSLPAPAAAPKSGKKEKEILEDDF